MQRDTLNSLLPTGGLGQQTGVIPFHDECYDEGRARAEGARRGEVSWVSRAKEAFQAGRSLMKGEGAWARARVFQATRMAPGKDPHEVQGLPCPAGEGSGSHITWAPSAVLRSRDAVLRMCTPGRPLRTDRGHGWEWV